MSRNCRPKVFLGGLALLSAVGGVGRAAAAFAADGLQGGLEEITRYPTLPSTVPCFSPQNGFTSRAVGSLNSFVNGHGTSTPGDVWCVYDAFRLDRRPAFTTACAGCHRSVEAK